ncbi:hypothetical protein [Dolosigranulum pigrum]|jgi:hypothetical protein|uniref:hypothetical protein n=1 Tax=Dolosigranulum pigrum TaxID=29394 RepID=UPI001AD85831|nr:hypothetical protein [Dolosigranulum pigrum]QTJ44231.1 hypothetical protein FE328_00975 [Dolosigranulum pigrum]
MNVIYYTPDELGYTDRGKQKWIGLMLSDHTDALNQLFEHDHVYQADSREIKNFQDEQRNGWK